MLYDVGYRICIPLYKRAAPIGQSDLPHRVNTAPSVVKGKKRSLITGDGHQDLARKYSCTYS